MRVSKPVTDVPDPACPVPEEGSLTLAQRLEATRRRSRERAERKAAKGSDGAAPLPPGRRTSLRKATKPPGPRHPKKPPGATQDPLVVKANRLVEAQFRVTLAEQRLLLCLLTKINSHPGSPLPVTAETRIEIDVALLSTLFLLPKKQAYELLKDAVDKLKERWLVIDAPDADTGLKQTRCRWVHTIDYYNDEGKVGLYLAPKVIPFLSQLASEFTSYRIRNVAKMTSVYAIRIYELLLQWREEGRREISLAWLKARLEIRVGEYERIDVFRTRVIEPAVHQINAVSNLRVRYTCVKRGRTVVGLLFEFAGIAEQRCVSAPDQSPRRPLPTDVIAALAHPGETWDQARRRLERARASPVGL